MSDEPRIRPIADDPSAENVETMFDLGSEEWLVTAEGGYQTGGGEVMRNDGSGWARVVILEWPARVNHSDELRTVRLVIDPEDASGLAKVLAHTSRWLLADPESEAAAPPEEHKDMILAAADMVGRTGATEIQLRYEDEQQPIVWMAVAGYPENRWECASATAPLAAFLRLCEQLIDGAECTHCHRPTGFDTGLGAMPLENLLCWYQYDPELKRFRRGCEGS